LLFESVGETQQMDVPGCAVFPKTSTVRHTCPTLPVVEETVIPQSVAPVVIGTIAVCALRSVVCAKNGVAAPFVPIVAPLPWKKPTDVAGSPELRSIVIRVPVGTGFGNG